VQGHDRHDPQFLDRYGIDSADPGIRLGDLAACRFLVGFGVTGLYTVDIAVVQEFVPASKRGWITRVTTTMLPAGFVLGALLATWKPISAGAGYARSGSCRRA
jgi:MFS family permease